MWEGRQLLGTIFVRWRRKDCLEFWVLKLFVTIFILFSSFAFWSSYCCLSCFHAFLDELFKQIPFKSASYLILSVT